MLLMIVSLVFLVFIFVFDSKRVRLAIFNTLLLTLGAKMCFLRSRLIEVDNCKNLLGEIPMVAYGTF